MKVDFYNYGIHTITKYQAHDTHKSKNMSSPKSIDDKTPMSLKALDCYRPMFSGSCSHILYTNMNKLGDAYGNTEMISPYEIKDIFKRLGKRPNAISTNNLLKQYRPNMHKVEGMVFDMFCDFPNIGNLDYQGILCLQKDKSLESLKEKQIIIINSADECIKELSSETRHNVEGIKRWCYDSIQNDTFCRKSSLSMLDGITSNSKEERTLLWQIYKSFYKLPSSSKDMDAFIVKYSRKNHEQIAQRLISPSAATIEHLIPTSRGGEDILGNCVLASAGFNHDRQHLVLSKFIELNDDVNIRQNLQRYISNAANLTFNENLSYFNKTNYPASIIKALKKEHVENFKYNVPENKPCKVKKKPIIYMQKTGRKAHTVNRH